MDVGIHEFCDAWYFVARKGFLRSPRDGKNEKPDENGYSPDPNELRARMSKLEARLDRNIHGEAAWLAAAA